MYQLVSALAQRQVAGSPWTTVNLSNLTLAQIDSDYSEVHLRVKSPFWTQDRTMLLSEVTLDYAARDQTIAQFFAATGSNTLPTIDGIASIKNGRIKYADAYWAGYQLERGKYLRNTDVIPHADDAEILIMNKAGVDGRVFHKNCLVSVNGLLHRVDADKDYIYVMDAGKSNYLSRRNEVGIINFRDIGELECHSITSDMLFRAHPNQPFANQIYIKAPVPASNKSVALVMGGYLFLLDNLSFFRAADDIFCLDTQSVALLDRFFESRKLIDLSSLGLEYNGLHNTQISRTQLFSDAVLTKWLTLSQSFLVYIDSPNILVERQSVEETKVAKQYLTYEKPTLPLLTGFGLLSPYWVQEDDNVFSVTIGDNVMPNHLFHTTPKEQATSPADNRIPYNREKYSPAHFLNILSEKLVITSNTPEAV